MYIYTYVYIYIYIYIYINIYTYIYIYLSEDAEGVHLSLLGEPVAVGVLPGLVLMVSGFRV